MTRESNTEATIELSSARYGVTRQFPHRRDKLLRLGATVRIDQVALFFWNQEFSGMRMPGAHFALIPRIDTFPISNLG